jgi:GTP cyclohydrolase II
MSTSPTRPLAMDHSASRQRVRVVATASLPTRFGDFRILAFSLGEDQKEHVAIVHGTLAGADDVPTRLHSECLTGDALGSLRCDCRDQLEGALRHIAAVDRGIVLYLRQEGRGIGLVNKVRAYALQDGGLDTVDANRALGFGDDERDYAIAAQMLGVLGVRSVRLLTNNPAKIRQLEHHGVVVTGRIPHAPPPNEHNRTYLETKAARFGHYLDVSPSGEVKDAEPFDDHTMRRPPRDEEPA